MLSHFYSELAINSMELDIGDNVSSIDTDEQFWIGLQYNGSNNFVWPNGRKTYFKRLDPGFNILKVSFLF